MPFRLKVSPGRGSERHCLRDFLLLRYLEEGFWEECYNRHGKHVPALMKRELILSEKRTGRILVLYPGKLMPPVISVQMMQIGKL